jgi:Fur family peroxide stress response transcriptional regulator
MHTVSLDTVCRTLWLLNDLGLLSTLWPRRESVRFDDNLEPRHHCVCVRCGLARNFESAEPDALRIPESVAEFGTIGATHVEVRGVCIRCASEQAGEPEKDKNPKEPGDRERSTP